MYIFRNVYNFDKISITLSAKDIYEIVEQARVTCKQILNWL